MRADDLGGLWSLRLPLAYPRTRSVNVFLLDRHTLLDCGSAVGAGCDGLERALELAGARLQDIRTLVLSHLHADHASLAGEFVERTGCELAALRRARHEHRPAARADDRPRRACARSRGAHGVPERRPRGDDRHRRWPTTACSRARPRTRSLRAGDTIAGWEVVPATGHSPNQMALWDGTRVIGADAAYPDLAPYLEWGHTPDPIAEYLATLDRLEALAPGALPARATARRTTIPRDALRSRARGRRPQMVRARRGGGRGRTRGRSRAG